MRRIVSNAASLSILLLAAILAAACGCAPDRAKQAADLNTSLKGKVAEAGANDAKAGEKTQSADGKASSLEESIFAWLNHPEPRPPAPVDAWRQGFKWLHEDLLAAHNAVNANPPLFQSILAIGDALQETTNQAVADKDDPLDDVQLWFYVAAGLCVPAAAMILWWTHSLEYAGWTLVVGLALVAAARSLGWTQDHPYLTLLLGLAVAAGVAAVEYLKHPNEGWDNWVGVLLGKAKVAATGGGKGGAS